MLKLSEGVIRKFEVEFAATFNHNTGLKKRDFEVLKKQAELKSRQQFYFQ